MPDLSVWPTDGADGSVSSEARWRKMARLWANSGVRSATDLTPTLAAGPTVNVTAGQCWVDGHLGELTGPASIPASASGIVVVRFTPADNHMEILYRDAVSVPVQTDATWELPIALMSAGSMFDRRALAVGATAAVAASGPANGVSAIYPASTQIPGVTLPLWGQGVYLVTANFDVEVATLQAAALAFGVITTTGPVVNLAAGMALRTIVDMYATKRVSSLLTVPLQVTAPAAAVLTMAGARSAAGAGVVNFRSDGAVTTLTATRIG